MNATAKLQCHKWVVGRHAEKYRHCRGSVGALTTSGDPRSGCCHRSAVRAEIQIHRKLFSRVMIVVPARFRYAPATLRLGVRLDKRIFSCSKAALLKAAGTRGSNSRVIEHFMTFRRSSKQPLGRPVLIRANAPFRELKRRDASMSHCFRRDPAV